MAEFNDLSRVWSKEECPMAPSGGKPTDLVVTEPATERELARLPRAAANDVDAAVERARLVYPGWRDWTPARRAAVIRRVATLLEEEGEDLARLEARNVGKPIAEARGDVAMAAETFRYFAASTERPFGETIPVAGGHAFTYANRWASSA